VGTIPVNIERIIKGQGIKLNTNAKPEDFTPNKKPKTEHCKDSLNRKITVHYFNGNAQVEVEGKNIKQVLTLARLDIKKRSEGWKLIEGNK
jgi:hypothetical protein